MKFIHVSHKNILFSMANDVFRAYVLWRDTRAEKNANFSCVGEFDENQYGKFIK
jgi:hypothetical protein